MGMLIHMLIPPSGLIILGLLLAGLWYRHPSRRRARWLALHLAVLYLSSTPITAALMARTIQPHAPLDSASLRGLAPTRHAIVVLAGGLYLDAPEYLGDTLHLRTLGRLRYGALLAQRSGLPLLLSGGYSNPRVSVGLKEADLMATSLSKEFAITPRWVEQQSRNTRENAINTAAILRPQGVDTVVLVTQALHMRRAVEAFSHQGLIVLAAPTLFASERLDLHRLHSWLPAVSAMATVHYACYEWLGLWYYRLIRWSQS